MDVELRSSLRAAQCSALLAVEDASNVMRGAARCLEWNPKGQRHSGVSTCQGHIENKQNASKLVKRSEPVGSIE